jgi:ubiquinone/menaquinone biosynthesis C-methylase UbiE
VIKSVINLWNLDVSNILDLACGSGEVTLALLSHGIKNIEGIDPYTYQSFEKRTKMLCKPLSFEDIVNGKLEGMRYSLIICSYALHLASEEILPVLSI